MPKPPIHCLSADPFFARMEAIWAAQRQRGHVPRTDEEVETERRCLRAESEEEIGQAEQISLSAQRTHS